MFGSHGNQSIQREKSRSKAEHSNNPVLKMRVFSRSDTDTSQMLWFCSDPRRIKVSLLTLPQDFNILQDTFYVSFIEVSAVAFFSLNLLLHSNNVQKHIVV